MLLDVSLNRLVYLAVILFIGESPLAFIIQSVNCSFNESGCLSSFAIE